jgi:hypothetical protein
VSDEEIVMQSAGRFRAVEKPYRSVWHALSRPLWKECEFPLFGVALWNVWS